MDNANRNEIVETETSKWEKLKKGRIDLNKEDPFDSVFKMTILTRFKMNVVLQKIQEQLFRLPQ